MKITAYLGKEGSYSYLVAQKLGYGKSVRGCKSFKEIIDDVETGKAERGILPIENSTTGSIFEVFDLLLNTKVQIIGEAMLKLNHLLLGRKKKGIKYCYCHPEAYKQCSGYLEDKNIKQIFVEDSATAVEKLKNDRSENASAIGNTFLAEKYNVKIVNNNIQNGKKNYTRFIVVEKNSLKERTGKATVLFSVKHKPGSLVKALESYARYGLNLTKIESRPIENKPWEYIFIIDVLVNSEKDLTKVLNEMTKHTEYIKVLGIYKKGKIYEA